jgi:anti-anti-sigma factor
MNTLCIPNLVSLRPVQDVIVVQFLSRSLLDPLAIEAVDEQLTAVLNSTQPKVLLDFEKVESVASAMIGRLVALQQKVEAAGGQLAFCGVGAFLAQIFSLCPLPEAIRMYPDEATAVAGLRG